MVRKNSTIVFLILILSISLASAICTVTFDKTNYVAGETIAAGMTCNSNLEKTRHIY